MRKNKVNLKQINDESLFESFKRNRFVQIMTYIGGIIVFLITVQILPETTIKNGKVWLLEKIGILSSWNDCSISYETVQIKSDNKSKGEILIKYPVIEFENDSANVEKYAIERIIANNIIKYVEKNNIDNYKTYGDIKYFFENYSANYPDSTFSLDIIINESDIKPKYSFSNAILSEYLVMKFYKYSKVDKSDTISVIFLNFDRGKKELINLESLFKGGKTSLFLVSEKKFKDSFKNITTNNYQELLSECFKDGFFHLPNNFSLSDDSINLHYFEYEQSSWKGNPLTLSIPFNELKDFINYESKLKFIRNRNE